MLSDCIRSLRDQINHVTTWGCSLVVKSQHWVSSPTRQQCFNSENLSFQCYEIVFLKNIVECFVDFLIVVLLMFLYSWIHVYGCNLGLNLLYIDSTNDLTFLRKEPLKYRGFRDENDQEKSWFTWVNG